MVKQKKSQHALYALHLLLGATRYIASTGDDRDKLVQALDLMHNLLIFLASRTDQTEEFRETLVAIAALKPEVLSQALLAFDETVPKFYWEEPFSWGCSSDAPHRSD